MASDSILSTVNQDKKQLSAIYIIWFLVFPYVRDVKEIFDYSHYQIYILITFRIYWIWKSDVLIFVIDMVLSFCKSENAMKLGAWHLFLPQMKKKKNKGLFLSTVVQFRSDLTSFLSNGAKCFCWLLINKLLTVENLATGVEYQLSTAYIWLQLMWDTGFMALLSNIC